MTGGAPSVSPNTFNEYIELLLPNALDSGIREFDFWEMTIAEVIRAIESNNRVKKAEAKEKAIFDYIHAGLVVKGVGITLGSKQSFPAMEDVYSSLFKEDSEELKRKEQEQKNNLYALRFLKFAQAHNQKIKREVQITSD